MAFKLRERARKIRENLFKIFFVCSAGIPMADEDEAPRHKEGRGRLRFVTRRQLDKAMAELQQPQVELTPFEMRLPSERICVPHQQVSSPELDMPSQPQMGSKVLYEDKLGLTRDLSRALQRRMPHQQASVPCQPQYGDKLTAGDFSIQAICKKHLHEQLSVPPEQVSQRISTPPQQVPAPPQQILLPPQQVFAPPNQVSFPPQQISMPHQHVSTLPQQISVPPQQVPAPSQQLSAPPKHVSLLPQQISVTPKLLPMTPQHVSMPRRFRNVLKFFCLSMGDDKEGRALHDVPHQAEKNGEMKEDVPHRECYFSHQQLFAACQQNGAKRGPVSKTELASSIQEMPPQQVSVPCQQAYVSSQQVSVPSQQVSVPSQEVSSPHQSRNGESREAVVKSEIASLLGQLNGGPSTSSIQEIQDMYEFIEKALMFRRSNLPVFEPSRSPQARPPIFAPRASFTHRTTLQPPATLQP